MCELIIDDDLQSMLDASRAEVNRRAAAYPHLRRTVPHAAGRPVQPPTPSAAITNPPARTNADGVGDPLEAV